MARLDYRNRVTGCPEEERLIWCVGGSEWGDREDRLTVLFLLMLASLCGIYSMLLVYYLFFFCYSSLFVLLFCPPFHPPSSTTMYVQYCIGLQSLRQEAKLFVSIDRIGNTFATFSVERIVY